MPPKRQAPKHESDVLKRLKGNPQEMKMYNDIGRFLCQHLDRKDSSDAATAEVEDASSKIHEEEEKNRDLQGQLRNIRREVAKLSKENGDLKTDMFKLQPKNQTSDSEIVGMYEGLQGQISSWVDGEIAAFIHEWKETSNRVPSHPDIFRCGNSQADSEYLAAGHRFGGEYLAETLMLSHLHETLLREDLIFFALSEHERQFLHVAADGLTNRPLSRDPLVVRYIRSESLKGFKESKTYDERRRAMALRLEVDLLNTVANVLPQASNRGSRLGNLRQWVIEPALDLAAAVMTSGTSYAFSRRMTPDTRCTHKMVQYRDLAINRCVMIDVDTRGVIKVSKIPLHGPEETIAEEVLLLTPALLRCDPGKPVKILTPEKICVKMVRSAQALDKANVKSTLPASAFAANLGLTKVDNKSQMAEENLIIQTTDQEIEQQTKASLKQKESRISGIPGTDSADVVHLEDEANNCLRGEERSAFPGRLVEGIVAQLNADTVDIETKGVDHDPFSDVGNSPRPRLDEG